MIYICIYIYIYIHIICIYYVHMCRIRAYDDHRFFMHVVLQNNKIRTNKCTHSWMARTLDVCVQQSKYMKLFFGPFRSHMSCTCMCGVVGLCTSMKMLQHAFSCQKPVCVSERGTRDHENCHNQNRNGIFKLGHVTYDVVSVIN
jgi:hypothetical protein